MRFGKSILGAISALALVAAPAVAQAAQSKAKQVSSPLKRVNTAVQKENKLGGGNGVIVAVVVAAAVILGIVLLSDGDSDSP